MFMACLSVQLIDWERFIYVEHGDSKILLLNRTQSSVFCFFNLCTNFMSSIKTIENQFSEIHKIQLNIKNSYLGLRISDHVPTKMCPSFEFY